jgi:pilus assembly protein CpaF
VTPHRTGGARGTVVNEVRDRLVRDGAAPTHAAVVSAVRGHPATVALGDRDLLHLAGDVHADLVGAGPLTPLLSDADVTDVLVNGDEVWVDRGHGLVRCPVPVGAREDVRRLAQRLAAAGGRRLDDNSPCVDARLADGTRLHAVLPPIAPDGPLLSLRTFRSRPFTLADLVSAQAFTEAVAEVLAAVVAARLAYLVTGGTGTGKSTLLATLLSLVPHDERIVLVEDSAELRLRHPHAVALQARTANVEGAGRVELRDLVRHALRMHPIARRIVTDGKLPLCRRSFAASMADSRKAITWPLQTRLRSAPMMCPNRDGPSATRTVITRVLASTT